MTFAPGDTAKTISVPIIDDNVEDGGETFTVTLSNPANATLGNRTATGTIHNNDDGLETPEDALTARFVNMPSEHAGPNERFTSELTFSEETPMSYKTLRDHSFSITGGHVRKAKRRQQGSNIGWQMPPRGSWTTASSNCACGKCPTFSRRSFVPMEISRTKPKHDSHLAAHAAGRTGHTELELRAARRFERADLELVKS